MVEKNVLVDVWLVSNLVRPLVEDALVHADLSADEFALFGLIHDYGPITSTDLARLAGMSPTTLSGIIGRCEARGLMTRTPNPSDRRSTLIELTAAGAAAHAELLPELGLLLERIHAALGPPIGEVRRSLEALDDALRSLRGLQRRRYRVGHDDHTAVIEYAGRPLDGAERAEVLDYIDWIRHRRS